jgi:hypothetical protein
VAPPACQGRPFPSRRRGGPGRVCCAGTLFAGLVLLVAGQVIRPAYRWLLSQRMTVMLAEARAAFDPSAFGGLEVRARHATAWARSDALNKITWMVIRKGGMVGDITVGDCLELTAALEEHHFRGSAGRPLFGKGRRGRQPRPGRPARLDDGARQPRPVRPRQPRMSPRPLTQGHRDLMTQYQDLRPSTTPPAAIGPVPTGPGSRRGRSASNPQAEDHRTPARTKTCPPGTVRVTESTASRKASAPGVGFGTHSTALPPKRALTMPPPTATRDGEEGAQEFR